MLIIIMFYKILGFSLVSFPDCLIVRSGGQSDVAFGIPEDTNRISL